MPRWHAALLVLVAVLFAGLLPAHTPLPLAQPQIRAAELAALPAPIPGAPSPSMALSVSSGYAEQQVIVTGEGVPGLPGVRVVWLLEGATYAAAVVATDPEGRYEAIISVPSEAGVGAAQLCVAATGSEQAAFACADFTVESPPPASLDMILPADMFPSGALLQQEEEATFRLLDMAGNTVASALVQPDGRVQIANIPPGVYQPILSGSVYRLSEYQVLDLGPAEQITTVLPLSPLVQRVDPVTREFCDNNDALVASIGALFSNEGRFTPPSAGSGASASTTRAGLMAARTTYYGPNRFYNPTSTQAQQPQLGWYVSGVSAPNQFQARIQSRFGNSVQQVEVWRRDATSSQFAKVADVARINNRFTYNMDVGTLPVGASELAFVPVVNGERQCSRRVTLNVAMDPLAGLFADTRTRWNSDGYYEFEGVLPKVPGLPVDLPLDVEYLGDLGTRMSAGLRIRGFLELNQVMTIDVLDAELLAKIVGQNLLNKRQQLAPSGTRFDPNNPRSLSIPVDLGTLVSVQQEITFFRGTILSWFGIFNLNGAVGARFGAGLAFRAVVYPLQPRFDATLSAGGFVGGWLEFSADLLGGLVEGGVRGGLDAIINLPLGVDVGSPTVNAEPQINVGLRTPCFRLYGYMQPYASAVWGLFKKRFRPITLFDVREPPSCSSITPQATISQTEQDEATLPRVLAQTTLAAGADGRMLALAIEDATPEAEAASPQLVARAWDVATETWGPPVALTDGANLVDRPTVAFYGDGTQAMAVWAQIGLDEASSVAQEETPLAQLRTFELYAATWDGTAWGTPERLTEDDVPDGRPSLAGGVTGLTLAWVRDLDGDASTPDTRIAVREWANGIWTPLALLGNGGRNIQVSVARVERGCPAGCLFYQGRAALAWTNDEDGSDATISDRTLRLATRIPGSDADWQMVAAPNNTPSGVDMPTVAISDDANGAPLAQLNVAFTELPIDESGQPIHVSDLAVLWAGYVADVGAEGWQGEARELLEDGSEIRAQRPLIQTGPSGETLLLFRRFGAGSTTATLGQLALTRLTLASSGQVNYTVPAYLSNGYRQHWQHSMAINSAGTMMLLAERRVYARSEADEAELRKLMADIPAVARLGTLDGTDGLVWAQMPSAADPALEPELELSQAHAPFGMEVAITATVRNLGREPIGPGGLVNLYAGTPEAPTLLDSVALPELGLNEYSLLTFTLIADGTLQPIFAEISSATDHDTSNNLAFAELGTPEAPELISAIPTELWPNAVEVGLAGPPLPGLEGYRIYRRTSAMTEVELVGETAGAYYHDLLLEREETYCYTARSFDATGLLSPPSAERCVTTPAALRYTTWLPLIQR